MKTFIVSLIICFSISFAHASSWRVNNNDFEGDLDSGLPVTIKVKSQN